MLLRFCFKYSDDKIYPCTHKPGRVLSFTMIIYLSFSGGESQKKERNKIILVGTVKYTNQHRFQAQKTMDFVRTRVPEPCPHTPPPLINRAWMDRSAELDQESNWFISTKMFSITMQRHHIYTGVQWSKVRYCKTTTWKMKYSNRAPTNYCRI